MPGGTDHDVHGQQARIASPCSQPAMAGVSVREPEGERGHNGVTRNVALDKESLVVTETPSTP